MADGLEMMQKNMQAFESGEDLPYSDDGEALEETEQPEVDQQEDAEEPETPEAIEKAKRDGYMTKDEWVASGKDPDDYMTPEEFARVGELRDDKELTRQQLAKRMVQQEKLVREVLTNQQKMLEQAEERGREAERQRLEKEQREAIEEGDTDRALEIEREKSKLNEKPKTEQQQDVEPAIRDWYEENSYWYNIDPQATAMLNAQLAKSQKAGIPFEDAIQAAMPKVKKRFDYLFDDEPKPQKQPLQRPARAVETNKGPAPKPAKRKTFADLPVEMREFAKKSAAAAGMTEQEYMESFNG